MVNSYEGNPGALRLLTFTKDPLITCTVLDKKNVEFEGEKTSLSAAAKATLHRAGSEAVAVQGPLYWEYEGENLVERRARLEEED